MKEDKNLEQPLDKSNEKLHISDVMNSIISELEKMKNDHIEVRYESSYDKGMKERMDGGISALEKAIIVIKRYCS
jgi:hypothetical protein